MSVVHSRPARASGNTVGMCCNKSSHLYKVSLSYTSMVRFAVAVHSGGHFSLGDLMQGYLNISFDASP